MDITILEKAYETTNENKWLNTKQKHADRRPTARGDKTIYKRGITSRELSPKPPKE
jgi:hypothetical protein